MRLKPPPPPEGGTAERRRSTAASSINWFVGHGQLISELSLSGNVASVGSHPQWDNHRRSSILTLRIGALTRSNSTVVISFFWQGFRGGALQNTRRFLVHGLEGYDDLRKREPPPACEAFNLAKAVFNGNQD